MNENIDIINNLIDSIRLSTDKCEKLATSIHFKVSPYGIPGKHGYYPNTPLIEKLYIILRNINFSLNILENINNILIKYPKEAENLKNRVLNNSGEKTNGN